MTDADPVPPADPVCLPVGSLFRDESGRLFRVEEPTRDETGQMWFTASRAPEASGDHR